MPNSSHHSEANATSNWQQSQQQKETLFSALKLIESETFFEIDYDIFTPNWSKSNEPALEEANTTAAHIENENERVVLQSNEPTETTVNTTISTQVTEANNLYFDYASATGTDTDTDTGTVNGPDMSQVTGSTTEELSAPIDAQQALAVQSAEETTHFDLQFHYPAYSEINLKSSQANTHVNELAVDFDAHWSAKSGWGEIDVFSALKMATDKPLTDDVANNSDTPTYLKALGFDKAWANGYTGQGVVIADIDTGIDLQNQTLMNNIHLNAYSWNFVNNTANVQDDNGHGTITAAELAMNGKGGAYGAELMVLKTMNANGQGSTHTIGQAIEYAVDHGASVINLSLGIHSQNTDIQNAIQYAYDRNVVIVAAAGNDATTAVNYPAAYAKQYSNVVAVGASQSGNQHDVLASYSNTAGSESAYNFVDAIGTGIHGYSLDGNSTTWSGTSMAAPLVAAEVAILKSANTSLSAIQMVRDILHSTNSLDDLLSQVPQISQTTASNNLSANTLAHTTNLATDSSSSHDTNYYGGADYLQASTAYVPTEQHY
jgi:subtilisin family serine protease